MSAAAPGCPSFLRFHSPSLSDSAFGHVAIAIGGGALGPSGHVGLLYKDGETVRCAHLEWHYHLKLEEGTRPGDGWVSSSLPELYAMQVAARCRRIVRANPSGLPYAPGSFGRFNAAGEYVRDEGAHGFTCATFILAVFAAADVPLVDVQSWPARDDDERFHRFVVEALEESLSRQRQKLSLLENVGSLSQAAVLRPRIANLENHLEAVRVSPRSARFRPDEVAAAISLPSVPVSFLEVSSPAAEITAYFQARATAASSSRAASAPEA
jgi:hypothetical protein